MADDGAVFLPPSLSDCELPPDVLSDSEAGPELPPDVRTGGPGPHPDVRLPPPVHGSKCACRNTCEDKVSPQAVQDCREGHLNLSVEDQANQVSLRFVCRCATVMAM